MRLHHGLSLGLLGVVLVGMLPTRGAAAGKTSTCMLNPSDYICSDPLQCDGLNSCCYLSGVCANSQAANCNIGDPNDPRFPPPGGADIVNQGQNPPDGCICVGPDPTYPNPNPICNNAGPSQGCWGTLSCNGVGTCKDTGYCKSGNWGAYLGGLCIQNGAGGTFKYCGVNGFVPTRPTTAPSAAPTRQPTPAPSNPPSLAPTTVSPTLAPSFAPTLMPTLTASPTLAPTTAAPTQAPTTAAPTLAPTTAAPTLVPTTRPTRRPTTSPTRRPTRAPTVPPPPTQTNPPTVIPPTDPPTPSPSPEPTQGSTPSPPTLSPTPSPPTPAPQTIPTPAPTVSPSKSPSLAPTLAPSRSPTQGPSGSPTPAPSPAPTTTPAVFQRCAGVSFSEGMSVPSRRRTRASPGKLIKISQTVQQTTGVVQPAGVLMLGLPANVTVVKVRTRPVLVNAKGQPKGACRRGLKLNNPATPAGCGTVTNVDGLLYWSMGPVYPKKKYTLTALVRPNDPLVPTEVEIPSYYNRVGGDDPLYPAVECRATAVTTELV